MHIIHGINFQMYVYCTEYIQKTRQDDRLFLWTEMCSCRTSLAHYECTVLPSAEWQSFAHFLRMSILSSWSFYCCIFFVWLSC